MAKWRTIGFAANGWASPRGNTIIFPPGAPACWRSGISGSASSGVRSTSAPTNCRPTPRNMVIWNCTSPRKTKGRSSAYQALGTEPATPAGCSGWSLMITRREILHVGIATAALAAGDSNLMRAVAQQRLSESDLLRFDAFGNVTLLHVADIHGQLMPVYFREPSVNLGVGEAKGRPPHLTGHDFLKRFRIPARSAAAYALTDQEFAALAKSYGRIGGLDRLATVIKHVRAERGNDKVLFLDGGDTWQGSLGANRSKGQDMVDCMAMLKPDAMTGHWEFTYGEARVSA